MIHAANTCDSGLNPRVGRAKREVKFDTRGLLSTNY